MTTLSPERQAFDAFKEALIKQLGTKALYDTTLNKVGKHLFPSWAGVFPVDRVPIKPNRYYIINTDPHDKSGQHWLGLYTTAKCAYIYDSYGRDPITLVPLLIQTIKKRKLKLCKTNLVPRGEQIGFTSELCGVYSLAWLLVVQKLGITKAKNI